MMGLGTLSDWSVVVIAQAGPTELFVPEGIAGAQSAGFPPWMLGGMVILVIAIGVVWMRAMGQRRVDQRELAFRALSRKLGLTRRQVAAVRAMGESKGLASPVGLLMSPSAVRSAIAE